MRDHVRFLVAIHQSRWGSLLAASATRGSLPLRQSLTITITYTPIPLATRQRGVVASGVFGVPMMSDWAEATVLQRRRSNRYLAV